MTNVMKCKKILSNDVNPSYLACYCRITLLGLHLLARSIADGAAA